MRVLVTGASGFIGRHAVTQLAKGAQFEVIAAARHARSAKGFPSSVIAIDADLLVPGECRKLIEKFRPTHLLHLAWTATPGRFWNDAENLAWVASTANLIHVFNASGGVRAVLAGSCAEYSWTTDCGKLSEGSLIQPRTFYGTAKDAMRRLACSQTSPLQASIAWARIFWLYGPGEPEGRLVSDVAKALVEGRPITVSEGSQRRDFLHVEDVAAAMIRALESDWRGPFNVGSGKAVQVRDITFMLSKISGRDDLLRSAASMPGNEPPLIEADIRVLLDEIGFESARHLDEGLKETMEWWAVRCGRNG